MFKPKLISWDCSGGAQETAIKVNILTLAALCGKTAVILRVIYKGVVYFRKFSGSKLVAAAKLTKRFNFSSQGLERPQYIQIINLG